MPTHKNLNKTEEVKKHLLRYKAITRATAASLFKAWDLPDVIKRIRSQGFEIVVDESSNGNTKYKLIKK